MNQLRLIHNPQFNKLHTKILNTKVIKMVYPGLIIGTNGTTN